MLFEFSISEHIVSSLSAISKKKKKKKNMMFEEKEEWMVPPKIVEEEVPTPKLRNAHFLKPLLNPKGPLPEKPHSSHLPSSSKGPKTSVHFRGRIKLQEGWEDWLENMKPTHQDIWKKAGIFDAIRASAYNIKRHDELIMWLAQKWCPETNTFIFPWGETTITLEDMLVLGGFSVLGGCVRNPCLDPVSEKLRKKLVESSSKLKKLYKNKPTHNQWLNHYKGRGGELENAAFIVLWLSRYIFSTNYYTFISPHVFPIAASLARGVKIALGPSILASIYRDLTLLKEQMVITNGGGEDGGFQLALWSPLQYLQLWAWERFPSLSPKPTSLASGEPRLARWHDLIKPKTKPKILGFDMACNGNDFVWRPYTLGLENWVFPKFYPDLEMCVLINSEVEEGFLSWARCISGCELVGMDCAELYHPHRVGMQFGMDQDIPGLFSPSSSDSYDKQFDGLKLYFPNQLFQGNVTMGYSCWWRNVPCWWMNVPCRWRNVPYESWTVYERRARSNKKTKRMNNFAEIEIEGQKGKKSKESHENMNNSKSRPTLDINSSKISENVAEEDTQLKELQGGDSMKLVFGKYSEENQKELESVKESKMAEDHEDRGRNDAEKKGINEENNPLDNVVIVDESEDDSNRETKRMNNFENVAEEDTQQCQEIRIQGRREEVKGGDTMELIFGNYSEENQKELECVQESEMAEDHEDRGRNDAEKKGLNEENNSLDNVVIIDESEDDSNESEMNPLEVMAFQLEARIKKVKLLISGFIASRQGR